MPNPHKTAMPNTQNLQRLSDAAQSTGIPISENHVELVAKSSDALIAAIDTVRSLDYEDHEPCNVFHPVILAGSSRKGDDQ